MAAVADLTPPAWALRTLPLHAGQRCGDAGGCFAVGAGAAAGSLLAIVDGLGHGPEAACAADAALQCIEAELGRAGAAVGMAQPLSLPALLPRLDAALAATRGAAIGLAHVTRDRLLYAGVGNTRALRWRGAQLLRLSSQYGIVGGGIASTVTVMELDLQPGDWLLLYTDGIAEMLQLPARLPEWQRDPALLCEHVLARWRDANDDAGVLVWQQPAAAAA